MTIPKECKRLAEVDFPIAEVSKHAVREKSIRHGHPSTLHLWWARRPLASSRAMLMALLLPDPQDAHCPPAFRERARAVLLAHHGRPSGWDELLADDAGLRKGLLQFIGDFANWDYAADAQWLKTARDLVKAAHPDETPLVVDPFAGGGSIPLEALRVGCDAFASDLNPVAVLINKVMLEDIPRYGKAKIKVNNAEGEEVEADGLAEALRIAGAAVKAAAEQALAEFYPLDPDGSRSLAYLWARTVRCEAPNCGAEFPLVRSFWLSSRASRTRAIRYTSSVNSEGVKTLDLEVFSPKSAVQVPAPTIRNARATCPCCGSVLDKSRLREQLIPQNGGASPELDKEGHRIGGAMILAKYVEQPNEVKDYRTATEQDYSALLGASNQLRSVSSIPDESIVQQKVSKNSPFRVHLYGMRTFRSLHTERQQLALATLADRIRCIESPTIQRLLGCVLSRCSDYWSSCAVWAKGGEFIAHTFGRQSLSVVWDFVESAPFSASSGNLAGAIEWVSRVVESQSVLSQTGQIEQIDAAASAVPQESASVWFTDPPYYDAVSYADLSDYFYVWLKRALTDGMFQASLAEPGNPLTPKSLEAIQDDAKTSFGRPKDKDYYESKMTECFKVGEQTLREDGIACVVFAHKTTEGWEALLGGMIAAGWVISASWPVATERPGRLRSHDSAALATSVHLICRPRRDESSLGDWGTIYRLLSPKVDAWMARLEPEGIRGADLVFACIGPALELYSQYSQVVDAEDRPIPLGGDPTASEPHKRGYLAYVWETVARLALEQVLGTGAGQSGASALEEDARLTALFLWTLQSTDSEENGTTESAEDAEGGEDDEEEGGGSGRKPKGLSLPFDVARRFAQPLGIHLDVWQGRIIAMDKGVVRLLPVTERTRQLFGAEGADAVAGELERSPLKARDLQLGLFAEAPEATAPRGRRRSNVADDDLGAAPGSTTLDRVHAAMLLQKTGRTNALRALLAAEQERGPAFLRLANALSGLYPRESEEKRLVDAMLLAYPK